MDDPSEYKMDAIKLFWSGPTTAIIVGVGAPVYSRWLATLPFGKAAFQRWDEWIYAHYQRFCSLFFFHAAGAKYTFYGDRPRENENVIYVANHQCTVDWFIVNVLANEVGAVGRIRYILKDALKMLPFYGWYFSQHSCVYISKRGAWADDQRRIRTDLARYEQTNLPYWLVVYPEGTRFDVNKVAAIDKSQSYAVDNGLPKLSQVLCPRTKAFTEAAQSLQRSCTAVYDVTVAYAREFPHAGPRPRPPSMWDLMTGRYREVHVHLRRTPMAEMPETEEGQAQWLHNRFAGKDAMLQEFYSGAALPNDPWSSETSRWATVAYALAYGAILRPFVTTHDGRKILGVMWLGALAALPLLRYGLL